MNGNNACDVLCSSLQCCCHNKHDDTINIQAYSTAAQLYHVRDLRINKHL